MQDRSARTPWDIQDRSARVVLLSGRSTRLPAQARLPRGGPFSCSVLQTTVLQVADLLRITSSESSDRTVSDPPKNRCLKIPGSSPVKARIHREFAPLREKSPVRSNIGIKVGFSGGLNEDRNMILRLVSISTKHDVSNAPWFCLRNLDNINRRGLTNREHIKHHLKQSQDSLATIQTNSRRMS